MAGIGIDLIPVRAHVTVHSVDLAGTLVGLPLPRMMAREVFSGREGNVGSASRDLNSR